LISNVPRLLNLRTMVAENGSLTIVEPGVDRLFDIKRVYYLHNLSQGAQRGSHAHRSISQLMVAISGSFVVELMHSSGSYEFHLSNPEEGLQIPPLTWRTLRDFSPGAVCLVFASELFDDREYIRDLEEFTELNG